MENPRNTGMGSAIMNRINEFRMQHTKAFVALVVVLALMGLGGCSSALGNNSSSDSANQQAALSAGVLSFTVEADQWDSATDGSIAVRITGESDDGSSVFEQCNVVPGEAHETTLGAGEYEVALVDGKATQGTRYFAAPVVTVSFDGTTDKNAVLQMKLDTAKMKQVEEEAAAKKAAEEKAAAEKAAAERPLRRKLQLKRQLPRKPLLKSKRKLKRNQLLNRRPLRDHRLQAIVPNQRKRCILPQVVQAKNIIPIRLVAR
ncbi:MAG: hypothetical protein UF218_04525 [Eggerthellaceae bacterium]|nr:hypothetical protein [Eggerthellaceae bacterium]